MKTNELIEVAQKLSKRYAGKEWQQELKQEGLLAGLEAISCGETDPDKIRGTMRRAMHRHRNFSTLPVTLPPSGAAMDLRNKLLRGLATDKEMGGPLYLALIGNTTSPEGGHIADGTDHAGEYELQEFMQYVRLLAEDILPKEDVELLEGIYYQGKTQIQMASVLGVSTSTINKRLARITQKIQDKLSDVL